MADENVAAQGFLNALTVYLKERLRSDQATAKVLEDRYGAYLEALGFVPDTPKYSAFMEHMSQMKDAGRVPKVP